MLSEITIMTMKEFKRLAFNIGLAGGSFWASTVQAAKAALDPSAGYSYVEFVTAAGITVGVIVATISGLTQAFRLYTDVKDHIRQERERDGKA